MFTNLTEVNAGMGKVVNGKTEVYFIDQDCIWHFAYFNTREDAEKVFNLFCRSITLDFLSETIKKYNFTKESL